jgi:ribosomal protein L29
MTAENRDLTKQEVVKALKEREEILRKLRALGATWDKDNPPTWDKDNPPIFDKE